MKGVSNQFNVLNDIKEREVEVEEELSEDRYWFLAKDTMVERYDNWKRGIKNGKVKNLESKIGTNYRRLQKL